MRSKKLPKFLTEQEINALLDAVSDPRDKAIIEIAYASGMRANELFHLKNGDIDLISKTVKVRHGKASRWNGTKERVAPIGKKAVEAVMAYKNLANKDESFTGYKNKQGFNRMLKRYSSKIGLRVTPHMLRHSAATHMINRGADIRYIQEFLGHENINTTQIYTHVDIERLKKDHQKLFPKTEIAEALSTVTRLPNAEKSRESAAPPNLILNNCTINVYIGPAGAKTEIVPNDEPMQVASKSLQLEKKEPTWIGTKEASEIFGFSVAFFNMLIKKHPELGDVGGIRHQNPEFLRGVKTWLNQEAVRDYLEKHPKHKSMSLATKKMVNVDMLAERAYYILKDSGKELYPDCSRVPVALRDRYMTYAEMARELQVSYHMYYKHVRPKLYALIKDRPEEKALKKADDREWARVTGSWERSFEREKELGRRK